MPKGAKKMDIDISKIGVEEAQRILAEQKQKDAEACRQGVQAVLDKYGFALLPVIIIRGGQILSQIEFVERQ